MPNTERKFLGVGRLTPNPRWHMDAHQHPFHELIIIVRGKMRVLINDTRLDAVPSDVLFYRSGAAHDETADAIDPVESIFISFAADMPEDTPVRTEDARGRIRQLASWLYDEYVAGGGRAEPVCQTFFAALSAEWLRLRKHPSHPVVETVHAFMRRHLTEQIGLSALAKAAGMSRFYFVRVYKRLTGRTPMDDLREMRVQHARGLILTTNLPLKLIAPLSGLGDEYRLSRVFKDVTGVRPGALRAHAVKG